MDYFNYQEDGQLWAEDVALSQLAEQYGTPLYVYSRATLERHWNAFDSSVGEHPHLVCYAVKANSNLGVLNTLARLGSGFDIVSGGELERVVAAGGDPAKVVFSGVGKTAAEMKRALELNIKCFNVESEPELERLNKVAGELGVKARFHCVLTQMLTRTLTLTFLRVCVITSSALPSTVPLLFMRLQKHSITCLSMVLIATSVLS